MAKGNLLLGTAGNSVGDVVMYRREGAQVSRVRVRKIKNPKTHALSLQRAAFSPVAKFYSPLAVVLERSFEGLSKMKSYNKFLKTNIDLARANGWLLPKGTGFFPLPYKLSQGTLPTLNYTINDDGYLSLPLHGTFESMTTMAQLSQVFVNNGAANGDIITIIVVPYVDYQNGDSHYPLSMLFEVNTNSEATIASTLTLVQVEVPMLSSGNLVLSGSDGNSYHAAAIICARFENDKWRRSTQFLAVDSHIIDWVNANKATAIASYGNNAGDPNALVYLDGDTLEG